jgi:putative intracellular protease/amidase
VVEAALAPAPAASAAPTLVPVVTPAPVAAFVPEPPATEVIAPTRARPAKKKRKAARSTWTPARWAAVVGVLVAVLIGGLVVRAALKKPAPTQAAANPTPPADPPPAKTTPARDPGAAVKHAPPAAPPRTTQVLMVLPTKGMWVDDYAPVRERLEAAGYGVKVAVGPPPPFGQFPPGLSHPAYEFKGPPVAADLELRPDLDLAPFGAVVFVGKDVGELIGPPRGEKAFLKTPPAAEAAAELIRRSLAEKRVLGGVCTGQVVLAKYGALDGKAVARSPFATKFGDLYPPGRAKVEDVPVRTDGRIVTSAGGRESAAAFGDALAAALRE